MTRLAPMTSPNHGGDNHAGVKDMGSTGDEPIPRAAGIAPRIAVLTVKYKSKRW
jgi:hypothetical protein